MGYQYKLVEEEVVRINKRYEVDKVDNQYYLDIRKDIDQEKYSVTRCFLREKGKLYLVVTLVLREERLRG